MVTPSQLAYTSREPAPKGRVAVCVALTCLSLFAPSLIAQKPVANASILSRRYKAAQDFQAANQLDKAAGQYRIFIADSLGQLAIGHAHAGEYDIAAADFDEALSLVPVFPALQLEYARVALESGNTQRAQRLASAALEQHLSDPKLAAKGHLLLGRSLIKLGNNQEAKSEIEQAVALDATFENGYELAIVDLNLGDGLAAAKIFSEMLSSFGDTAQIHMLFGQAYAGSDFQAKAVEEFQAAIARNDKLPGAHYSLAAGYVATAANAKLAEAESELRKELVASPSSAATYAALGHLLANQIEEKPQNADEAMADLKRATQLDPTNPDVFLYLGQLYVDRKMPTDAEVALRKCIALTSDPSRNAYQVQKAHFLLGRILVQSGRTDEGRQEMKVSQELTQQNLSRDQNRLSDYLQIDKAAPTSPLAITSMNPAKDPEAVRLTTGLEKQLAPVLADSYNNLGAIAGTNNDYKLALTCFQHAAQWNPALPGLDYNWGRAAFTAGSPADAIGPLSRYVRAHPSDDGALTVLGLSQFLVKDYIGARNSLASVVDKPGAAPQVQLAYARSLIETNDLPKGVARLLALEKADDSIADVHRTLGEAYVRQNAPAAADELQTAIRLNPADAAAHADLADLQLKRGDLKNAVANLEDAVRLDPGNAAFREQLAQSQPHAPNN